MPIGVLNPQILSPEQANPFLYGLNKAAGIANILAQAKLTEQQAMMQKLNSEKMRQLMPLVEPTARAELEKAQLYNQNYQPNMESQINLRKSQANNYNYEAEKLRALMPYIAQQAQSNLTSADIKNNLLKQILGNDNQNKKIQPNVGNMGSMQNNMPIDYSGHLQQQESQTNPNTSYTQAAVAHQILGLPQPKIVDLNGTQTALTAFGAIPVAQGLTEQQKSFQQGIGKSSAEAYKENEMSFRGAQNQNIALDNLINIANNDPEFRNVVGPVKSSIVKWLGNPAQKQTLGTIMSSSGEVTLQVAPALKGAFTGRDQNLINEIKANSKDFPDVFIGKLKAQKLVNQVLMNRTEIANQLIEQGVSTIKANKIAAEQVPLDKVRIQINQLIRGSVPEGFVRMLKNGKEYHIPKTESKDAENAGFTYG